MKKEWIVILCTCVIIIGLMIIQIPKRISNNPPKSTSSNVLSNSTANACSSQENSEIITMASTTSKSNIYTVKEYDGCIGIFYNNETEPREVYDTDISTLPEEDQQKLIEGIVTNDKNTVYKIIEDFAS